MASSKSKVLPTRSQIIEKLGLSQYQDTKLSLQDARGILLQQIGSKNEDVPWTVIDKLMRADHRFQDKGIPRTFLMTNPFHILDIILVIFTSCDMLLRQVLAQKMSLCRKAIPFIIPYPEDRLEYSLWPLRSIMIEWVNPKRNAIEVPLVDHAFKTVSFIRLGDLLLSKSKTLNKVMPSASKDTFFHRDCPGGNKKRCIAEGLIEMSYFLPTTMSTDGDSFSEELLCLNLRGNAVHHTRQRNFLCEVASVVVCFAEITKLIDKNICQTLRIVSDKCVEVILVLTHDLDSSESDDELMNKLDIEDSKKSKLKIVKSYEPEFDNSKRSSSDFASDIREKIKESIQNQKAIVIKNEDQILRQNNIIVDEEVNILLKDAIKDGNAIINNLEENEILETKRRVLPLQGDLLLQWSNLLKEKHRGGEDAQVLLSTKSDIEMKMKNIRMQQLDKSSNIETVLQKFIDWQQGSEEFKRNVYFKWIQIELDDMSRKVLPNLRHEYKEKWRQRQNDPIAVKVAEKNMDESSLGLEHMFREMGQLYECIQQLPNKATKQMIDLKNKLPQIAAMYFLNGHPFELMDGDSGVVSVEWVKAVFEELKSLISEEKMYVLSVVGIQSSGKSTLLNSMFGLELAVGAGRCTRGIYAQLLPVGKESNRLNVDYILILDSEGLCGLESVDRHKHDNEIATLVIGLADLTIVNTKGENYQQMQDMLEIAVHVFIRMKGVKNFKAQKCLFVHHSVSSSLAESALTVERHKLQDSLDDMAKEAAAQENMSEVISKFSHVIDFDCERNVFYVPNFWEGAPPMLRVNMGYSDKIKEIRTFILQEIKISTFRVKSHEMQSRLEDMWNGVLADDFLFSFKNSMSVKAYLLLEREFFEIMRQFESDLIDFTNSECRSAIDICETENAIDTSITEQKTKIENRCEETGTKYKDQLHKFIDDSDTKEYLKNWRNSKEEDLSSAMKKVVAQICNDLEMYSTLKREEIKHLIDKKTDIIKRAQTIAQELKGRSCSDEMIRQKFQLFWGTFEKEVKLPTRPMVNVREDITGKLEQIFRTLGHTMYLRDEMPAFWADTDVVHLTSDDIQKEYIANRKFPKGIPDVSKLNKPTVYIETQTSRIEFFSDVLDKSNVMLSDANDYICKLPSKVILHIPHESRKVIQPVIDKIRAHNSLPLEKSEFTLTARYQAMMAVRVARMLAREFEKLHAQDAWIKTRKDAFRQELFHVFANTVNKKVNELPADNLCDLITSQVKQYIDREITNKSVDKILQKCKYTKHSLLVEVLTSLAKKKSFDEYIDFQNDMYLYCMKWVEQEIIDMIFDKINGKSVYAEVGITLLDNIMEGIIKAIENSTEDADKSKPDDTMSVFIEAFSENIKSTISLTKSEKIRLKEQNITDFIRFKDHVLKRCENMKSDIAKSLEGASFQDVVWSGDAPHKQIMAKIWGCKETCPCCSAPCIYTSPNHLKDGEKHECMQHWPAGFTGRRWVETKSLSTDVCSFLVASDACFRCSACRYVCRYSRNCDTIGEEQKDHPYKEYKEFIQNWEIECDSTGEASKYWQWVMWEFKDELMQHYKIDAIDIPDSWKIEGKEAVESLHRYTEDEYRHDAADERN